MHWSEQNRSSSPNSLTRGFAFAAVAVVASLAAPASAALITATWSFTGGSAVATTTGSNFTADNATIAPQPVGTTGFSSTSNNLFIRTDATTSSESGAVTDGDYAEFKITAAPGYQIDLTSLTFKSGNNVGAGNSISGITNTWFARYSVNSYATTLVSQNGPTSGAQPNPLFTTPAASWTSASAEALGAVTFRIYAYDTVPTANHSNAWNRLDDVVITADVTAVPEPSSLGLLIAGGLLMTTRRRRTN